MCIAVVSGLELVERSISGVVLTDASLDTRRK